MQAPYVGNATAQEYITNEMRYDSRQKVFFILVSTIRYSRALLTG